LSQAQNAIKEADIAAAEAAVAAAEANLKSVEIQYTRNPEPDDIQANTALAQAREQLASAQSRLDLLLAGPDENQVGSAQAGVSAAAAQRDAAAAQLNKATADPTTAQRAAVEAQLAQAEAQLANLTDGATAEEVRAAEAEVAQAEVNLADAQAALDAATLRAPFAGVVTEVFFNAGEIANGPIIKLVDESSLRVVLEADEVDIGRLAVGQPATVVLEAWPEETIPSEVVAIAPSATTIPGSDLVIYEVQLSLTDVGLPILVGMTADADLITAEKEDVLLVPNRAINVDRATGTYSVNLIAGENVEEVPVAIGLRDSQYTEITSGLSEGDQLLIGGDLPVIDFQQGPPGQQD
jgi:HlyD family secretion protein